MTGPMRLYRKPGRSGLFYRGSRYAVQIRYIPTVVAGKDEERLIMEDTNHPNPTPQTCPFCLSDRVVPIEVDQAVWAVCCRGCKTIGPHGSAELEAIKLWSVTRK